VTTYSVIVDSLADPLGQGEHEVPGVHLIGDRDEVPQQHLGHDPPPCRRPAAPPIQRRRTKCRNSELVAAAISAERRWHIAGAITDEDLRAAHDQLYASGSARHRAPGVLEALAQALLGRGLCQRCRQQEVFDAEGELNQATGVIPEPGESADSLLHRRLTGYHTRWVRPRGPG
jgi:hypothetical protein